MHTRPQDASSLSRPGPKEGVRLLPFPRSSSHKRAGRLSANLAQWKEVTSSRYVLSIIQFGVIINFHSLPPMLTLNSSPPSPSRLLSISSEVSSLLDKGAIIKIRPSRDQFVSPIFTVPKKDSSDSRVILNLKVLNNYIIRSHFRLEGYNVIIQMLQKDDFLVSVDLKDAFLMFSMHCIHQKYLCFDWLGVRYCYVCMPFGLTSAPRTFTKVLRSVLVFLRGRGLRISAWFDDIIIMANSVSLLLEHLHFARLILRSLGFLINDAKSNLNPSKTLRHLGYNWDSRSLTLSVPDDKVAVLKELCQRALRGPVSLRFLQRILGVIESFRIAFPYAALHYRSLQREVAQSISAGSDWDRRISPSSESCVNLNWWLSCPVPLLPRSLSPFVPDITITSDSSNWGWGAFTSLDEEVYGFWSDEELTYHINVLEALAVLYAFKSLFRNVSGKFVCIQSDNSTTVSYINHLGGVRSQAVTEVITGLYNFCLVRDLSVKAQFLQGKLNVRADGLSRRTRDHCYSLPNSLFEYFCEQFQLVPEIDLFATRHNTKLPNFYSEKPDPFSQGFDSFTMPWPGSIYAFPPVMLVGKFLSYFLKFEILEGLIIAPYWPAQSFFPVLLGLLSNPPFIFSVSHLMGASLAPRPVICLLACNISSHPGRRKAYLDTLLPPSSRVSILKPSAVMLEPGTSLPIGVLGEKIILAQSL